MNTMGDYHDLYLKTDVLLLANIYENFINTCLNYYKKYPFHYFSSPSLAWDAILKMTEIELDLISDIDVNLFIEKRIRRGISHISKTFSKANNKYMKCYDGGKKIRYIMYLDANNLYGYAVSQYLPYDEFKWLNKKGIDRF